MRHTKATKFGVYDNMAVMTIGASRAHGRRSCSSPGEDRRICGSPGDGAPAHAGGTPPTYDWVMKYLVPAAQLPHPKRAFVLITRYMPSILRPAIVLACVVVTPAYANQPGGLPVYPHSVRTKTERPTSGFVASLYESHDASGVVDAWYRAHIPACHRGHFPNGLIKYACPNGFIDVEPHSGGTIIEIVSKSM